MNELTNSKGLITSLTILFTVVFYYIYYYFAISGLPEKFCRKINSKVKREVSGFIIKKLSGFFILGLIPLFLYLNILKNDFDEFGMSFTEFSKNIFLISVLLLIIFIVLYLKLRSKSDYNSVQINVKEWNILLFAINAAGWSIYLFGYELLFRGILLSECYRSFGFWPAIVINISIYSAIHMVYGKEQTVGAMILGFVACYFTLCRGTVLIPVFMHVTVSLLCDFLTIRFNKSYRFIRQKGFYMPEL